MLPRPTETRPMRPVRSPTRVGPRRLLAAAIARRALARDHPVTPTSSFSIRPLSFFAAAAYLRAYLFVIS